MALSARATVRRLCTVAAVVITAIALGSISAAGQASHYPTGTDGYYPPVNCTGLYDRGLWQLDSQAWASITNECAFTPNCNADGAYGISQDGQSFTPWATYTSGAYDNYLSAAQAAVGGLRHGTVPGGVPGVCLSRVKYAANAAAVIARCGSGARRMDWRIAGPGGQGRHVLPGGRVGQRYGGRPAAPLQRLEVPAVDRAGHGPAAQCPGRAVPARPGRVGRGGHGAERGVVQPGQLACLVAAVSTGLG